MRAEANESEIMKRIALLDPLQGLEKGSPINLPLTAFCYLVRRLAVSDEYHITYPALIGLALNRYVPNTVSSVTVNWILNTKHSNHMSVTPNSVHISITHSTAALPWRLASLPLPSRFLLGSTLYAV